MRNRRILPVLLAGILQLMPMLRAVLPLEARAFAPSAWAIVLKLAAGTVALLGSYHTVSGATSIVGPYTINGTVGTAFSRQLTTSGQTAHSWSANTAPLGSATFPLVSGLTLTNSNGRIGGVPTAAITTNVTISAWENSGNKGASISAIFTITVTNGTGPPPPTPPSITTQPQSQTNYTGTSATFTVAASGTAPLAYQWRFGGSPIANATNASYTRSNLQTTDAGNYSVVVTNAAGAATSGNAVLTVLVPTADVAVGCTGPASVLPNASFNYTVSVTNLGPTIASNVVVSDVLPPMVTFVSASGSGAAASGTINWPAISTMASGATATFTVTVTAPASGSLNNVVSATSGSSDPNAANNNGSAGNAQVVTTVAAQADVSVACSGPGNVVAAASFNYTVTVSNAGPSTATNVVVSDVLPPSAIFSSASDSGTLSSGMVTWPAIASLAGGGSATYTVTVTAPSGGVLTNIASGTSATPDPAPSNNNGSAAVARVITTVGSQADLAIGNSGPAAVVAGSNFTCTIVVTNLGPSPSTNVLVSNRLPAGAALVGSSGGGALSNNVVNWPVIPVLASGGTASFTVTLTAPASGSLTNTASAFAATPDPNAANNDGTLPAAMVVTAVVTAQGQFGLLAGAIALNPQTGFYEQHVTITNTAPVTAAAVRLDVGSLRAGVHLNNAAGTNAGVPYAQFNAPLNPGATVVFLLEFYVPDRQPFADTLLAEAVLPATIGANSAGSTAVNRVFFDTSSSGSQRFVIEFSSIPGRVYTVIYSDDGTATWNAATPAINASATVTQWYDDGPPKTMSPPASVPSRLYRVLVAP